MIRSITDDVVSYIRNSPKSNREMSEIVCLAPSTISKIRRYKTYNGKSKYKNLSRETLSDIRKFRIQQKEYADLYKVARTTIGLIQRNEIYKDTSYFPPPKFAKLTMQQRKSIINSVEGSEKIGSRYGVSGSYIRWLRREARRNGK